MLYTVLGVLFSMVKYQECIQSPITKAQTLKDPVQIAQELARAEKATTQVINEATFHTPAKLVQFRNLLKGLKDHMAQADNLTDRHVLELRNEILGLPNARLEFLIVELFNFKVVVLTLLLLAITIAIGLKEDRQRSTSGRI